MSDEQDSGGNGNGHHLEAFTTKSSLRKKVKMLEEELAKTTFTAKHLYAERVQLVARVIALEKAKPEEVLRATEVADKVMELFGFDPQSLRHALEAQKDALPPAQESDSVILGPQGKPIVKKRF